MLKELAKSGYKPKRIIVLYFEMLSETQYVDLELHVVYVIKRTGIKYCAYLFLS